MFDFWLLEPSGEWVDVDTIGPMSMWEKWPHHAEPYTQHCPNGGAMDLHNRSHKLLESVSHAAWDNPHRDQAPHAQIDPEEPIYATSHGFWAGFGFTIFPAGT